ncbi:MAG: glycoside hydrolase family 27 protein [Lachnospiraceae bacterium]|nr:glycoside hydrolase family 27 protein [Lachnospiraceae bacterium]
MYREVRPPMGWNSYDYYDTTVNEAQVIANADYMAEHLREYGWEYIVVDIAWYSWEAGTQREKFQYVPFAQVEMDEYSRLLPCPKRFPSSAGGKGFAPLADYIHRKGLKFGIHIMRGIPREAAHQHTAILGSEHTANEVANPYSICPWNPDMYGVAPGVPGAQEYYDSLMQLYAQWGVDFIKCDDICRMDAESARAETVMLHRAIEKCGRDIVLSLSPGPAIVEEADFYFENADMWRITDDFWDNWESLRDMFDRCRSWQGKVRDGGYPDCDMLPLGQIGKGFGEERRTGLTREEQRTMMTLWCLFRSPLMLGAELTKLDEWTVSLLTNPEVLHLLEVSKNAREIYRDSDIIVWRAESRDLRGEYLAMFNISEFANALCPKPFIRLSGGNVQDLWEGCSVRESATLDIPAHGCILLKIWNEG